MQVEEIALVNIVLRRWDGARIWYPTTSIISIPLLNLTRSNNKWEFFQVLQSFEQLTKRYIFLMLLQLPMKKSPESPSWLKPHLFQKECNSPTVNERCQVH